MANGILQTFLGRLFAGRDDAPDAERAIVSVTSGSAQLLDAVIASLPDAAIVLDRDGRVVAFNAAARVIAPALARSAPASLALRAPERIEALVLGIPPTAWETRAAQADTYLQSVGFLEDKGMDAFIEASRKLPAQPAWTAPTREARLAFADDVITNTGRIDELQAQVGALHSRYLTVAAASAAGPDAASR